MHRPGSPRRLAAAALALGALGATCAGASALGAAAAPARTSAGASTWADVAPVLAAKCARCHMPKGIAPFPLRSYADAKAHAALIAAVVRSGQMPPWMPGPDSPAFIGQEQRVLSAAEKAAILDWVKGGARR